jgi:hypothetical protein
MNARPILFSGEMVRALLDGRKTQDRRIVRPQPPEGTDALRDIPGENHWWAAYATHDANGVTYRPLGSDQQHSWRCPYGGRGNLLYVKEAWAQRFGRDHLNGTELYESGVREAWYWADGPGKCCRTGCAGAAGRYRHARFMPRWASRITLRLTDVRVERLQDIRGMDALREGVSIPAHIPHDGADLDYACREYRHLWESINGPGSWDANPWVWALTFDVIPRNVDEVLKEPESR